MTEFGSSFEALMQGKLQIPPQGFRANVSFEGPISGQIEGMAEGIDYIFTGLMGELN